MRPIICLVLLAMLAVDLERSEAVDCIVNGPVPRLDSQPIEWTVDMTSGQRCLRGLRSMAMQLESVIIQSPARFGHATTQGYGFAYQAPTQFKGEDTFSVLMSGKYRGVQGRSVIQVHVTVR